MKKKQTNELYNRETSVLLRNTNDDPMRYNGVHCFLLDWILAEFGFSFSSVTPSSCRQDLFIFKYNLSRAKMYYSG